MARSIIRISAAVMVVALAILNSQVEAAPIAIGQMARRDVAGSAVNTVTSTVGKTVGTVDNVVSNTPVAGAVQDVENAANDLPIHQVLPDLARRSVVGSAVNTATSTVGKTVGTAGNVVSNTPVAVGTAGNVVSNTPVAGEVVQNAVQGAQSATSGVPLAGSL
ncbi:hypothetical protein BGX21_004630 [Mortierella sp. AD011]|nr:hypothetical protein BGX21_004630 [Mortierella sp. AD011]